MPNTTRLARDFSKGEIGCEPNVSRELNHGTMDGLRDKSYRQLVLLVD
jgi:hypothetical protein